MKTTFLYPLNPNYKKAHTNSEIKPLVATAGVWKKKRDDLKSKQNSLFETYTKDPQNIHLAREIKDLDDQIADFTQHVEQERRAEQRATSSASKLVTTTK